MVSLQTSQASQPSPAVDPDAPAEPPPKRTPRWLAPTAAAAVLLLGTLAWLFTRPTEVETAVAWRGQAVEAVYASGVVDFTRQARVSPVVTSPIRVVRIQEGEMVRPGQLLAELVDNPERATALQLNAQAGQARSLARRTAMLHRNGFASDAALEDARAQADAATAAARAAEAVLADYRIVAPFLGRVMRRDAEPGDLARPGDTLFVVADPQSLRITADVDERDAARLRSGLTALVRSDAFPRREFEARVTEITPQGDARGRVFRARLSLAPQSPLRPGMTVEVNIVLESRNGAVLVPTGALREGSLFVVENGRARRRVVRIGVQGAEQTEIRSGLTAGDRVIVSPPAGLGDGARIAVRRAAKAKG